MASVFDKVMGLLGVKDEDELAEVEYEEEVEQPQKERNYFSNRSKGQAGERKSNLVSLAGGLKSQVKLVIVEPTKAEEVRLFVDHLKHGRAIIIRLEKVEKDVARQIIDFMSGATHALEGNMRKIGGKIFCFTPHSVSIEGDIGTSDFFEMREPL